MLQLINHLKSCMPIMTTIWINKQFLARRILLLATKLLWKWSNTTVKAKKSLMRGSLVSNHRLHKCSFRRWTLWTTATWVGRVKLRSSLQQTQWWLGSCKKKNWLKTLKTSGTSTCLSWRTCCSEVALWSPEPWLLRGVALTRAACTDREERPAAITTDRHPNPHQ